MCVTYSPDSPSYYFIILKRYLEGYGGGTGTLFSHSVPHSTVCLEPKENIRKAVLYFNQQWPGVMFSAPTQPDGELLEGNQVITVLGQQGEGAVGQRVRVLAGPRRPRCQQAVEAFELRSVQPILPLHKGVTGVAVLPCRRFCCCCRAAVAPVEGDKVLRLESNDIEVTLKNHNSSKG